MGAVSRGGGGQLIAAAVRAQQEELQRKLGRRVSVEEAVAGLTPTTLRRDPKVPLPGKRDKPTSFLQGVAEGALPYAANAGRIVAKINPLMAVSDVVGGLIGVRGPTDRISAGEENTKRQLANTGYRGSTAGNIVGNIIGAAPTSFVPGGLAAQGAAAGFMGSDWTKPAETAINTVLGGATGKFLGSAGQVLAKDVAPYAAQAGRAALPSLQRFATNEAGTVTLPEGLPSMEQLRSMFSASQVPEGADQAQKRIARSAAQEISQAARRVGWEPEDVRQAVAASYFPEAGLAGADSNKMISNAVPTSPNWGQGNPFQTLLMQSSERLRANPETYAKATGQIADLPFMGGFTGTSDEILNRALDRGAENLLSIYSRIPGKTVEETAKWYETAHNFALQLAQRYGLPQEGTAAIIAAFSPQKAWHINVANAERLLEMNRAGWGSSEHEVQQALNEINRQLNLPAGKQGAIAKERGLEHVDRVMRTPMEELTDPIDRHTKVVMTDFVRNSPGVTDILPTGERIPSNDTIKWGQRHEVGNALSILNNPTMANIAFTLSGGGKVPSFYNNIINPWSRLPIVTADTHSSGGVGLWPAGSSDTVALQTMGIGGSPANSTVTGNKGYYGPVVDMHVLAGQRAGLSGRQMQSVTWEGLRKMWGGSRFKDDAVKDMATAAWRRNPNDPAAAQLEIFDYLNSLGRRPY